MGWFRSIPWRATGLVLVTASALAAPPTAFKGWGQATDPDGDCRFEQTDGKLTLRVPGTHHNLVADSGHLNAPRVLSPVRGEFIAMVKATGSVHPGPESSVPDGLPYNGTGLLLWVDRNNYVRLERAGLIRNGAFITYVNFEHFSRGRRVFSQGHAIQDRPTDLRLERREGKVFASASHDGVTWSPFPSLEIRLPNEVKLGVTAVNSSRKPFVAELEGLVVFTRREAQSR
jgi:hypothetical protein